MTSVCGSYVEASLSLMLFFPTLRGTKDDLREPPEKIAILSTLDLDFWKAILESKTGHFGEQHTMGQIRELTCCQAHKGCACELEECYHKTRNKRLRKWHKTTSTSHMTKIYWVFWPCCCSCHLHGNTERHIRKCIYARAQRTPGTASRKAFEH